MGTTRNENCAAFSVASKGSGQMQSTGRPGYLSEMCVLKARIWTITGTAGADVRRTLPVLGTNVRPNPSLSAHVGATPTRPHNDFL